MTYDFYLGREKTQQWGIKKESLKEMFKAVGTCVIS